MLLLAIMLTKEEAEAASVLATHNALINLGKYNATLELEKALRIKKLENLKKYLLKGKEIFSINSEYTKLDTKDKCESYVLSSEFTKYLDAVNEYIGLVDDEEVECISKIEKLENYVQNIDLDYKTAILENENLETQFETKEKYWSNRVIKLREKCIQKNEDYQKLENKYKRLLKILYSILMISCFLIIIINYIGFEKLLKNSIYYSCNTLNFIYFTIIICYKCFNMIYQFVLNYHMLLASLIFGFISQKYLQIKKRFIIIALILFLNVGKSLYKS